MGLRFSYFARTYIEEVDRGGHLSESEREESMRWSLIKFEEKRIKKEGAIKATTKQIGLIAQVLVWGNRLLTSALTILASAPIRVFSKYLGGHTETLLCLWFYFSGLLVGLSTHSVKKQLSKGYQWLISEKKGKKRVRLERMTIFRLFLSVSTAMSSCYFGLFAIRRLLKRPEDIGAHILINFLSKWLLPQIWPIIMPVWVFLTISSAMINQYKDTKVFARLSKYIQWKWESRSHNGQKQEGKTVDMVRHSLIALVICVAAVAAALSIYVTVVKMTANIMLSVLLSGCVWLVSYAKYTLLFEKITQLMDEKKDVTTTIREYNDFSFQFPSPDERPWPIKPEKDLFDKNVLSQSGKNQGTDKDLSIREPTNEELIKIRAGMRRRGTF